MKSSPRLVRHTDNIGELVFCDQKTLCSTMMRFQEFYESPEFAGKYFTHKEYRVWYKKSRNARRYTYNTDWAGFNIPAKILNKFLEVFAGNITKTEQAILDMVFEEHYLNPEAYIIATSETDREDTLEHELAHALYATESTYRRQVNHILAKQSLDSYKKRLLEQGYCEAVLLDEIQAYAVEDDAEMTFKADIRKLFLQYIDVKEEKL